MNPASVDLLEWLDTSALFTDAVDLFVGEMPDDPDECVCLYDYGGASPHPDPNMVDRNPRVNIRIRGDIGDYPGSYSNALSIISTLHGKHNEIKNSTRYISIFATSEPLWLGYDEKQRPQWSINFKINRTE